MSSRSTQPLRQALSSIATASSTRRGRSASRRPNLVRAAVADFGIDDLICSRRRQRGTATVPKTVPLGMRWPIERTNSWLSNFGQLRRNTDRRSVHRLAQLGLAIVLLILAKLIDWRNRWSPEPRPIR